MVDGFSSNPDTRLRGGGMSEWQFLQSDLGTVMSLLAHDDLNVMSELEVFDLAVKWIDHDKLSRIRHALQILEKVRFALMSRDQLLRCYEIGCEDIFKIPDCKNLLLKANWQQRCINENRVELLSLNDMPKIRRRVRDLQSNKMESTNPAFRKDFNDDSYKTLTNRNGWPPAQDNDNPGVVHCIRKNDRVVGNAQGPTATFVQGGNLIRSRIVTDERSGNAHFDVEIKETGDKRPHWITCPNFGDPNLMELLRWKELWNEDGMNTYGDNRFDNPKCLPTTNTTTNNTAPKAWSTDSESRNNEKGAVAPPIVKGKEGATLMSGVNLFCSVSIGTAPKAGTINQRESNGKKVSFAPQERSGGFLSRFMSGLTFVKDSFFDRNANEKVAVGAAKTSKDDYYEDDDYYDEEGGGEGGGDRNYTLAKFTAPAARGKVVVTPATKSLRKSTNPQPETDKFSQLPMPYSHRKSQDSTSLRRRLSPPLAKQVLGKVPKELLQIENAAPEVGNEPTKVEVKSGTYKGVRDDLKVPSLEGKVYKEKPKEEGKGSQDSKLAQTLPKVDGQDKVTKTNISVHKGYLKALAVPLLPSDNKGSAVPDIVIGGGTKDTNVSKEKEGSSHKPKMHTSLTTKPT